MRSIRSHYSSFEPTKFLDDIKNSFFKLKSHINASFLLFLFLLFKILPSTLKSIYLNNSFAAFRLELTLIIEIMQHAVET